MASLEEFLKINSTLITDNLPYIDIPQDTSLTTLKGILMSASEENYIVLSHLGQDFYVASSDVIDIKEIDSDPVEKGIPVEIKVKANTRLIPYEEITAIDLNRGEPFAIARPSQIPEINYTSVTAKELAWLAKTGISSEAKAISRGPTISIPSFLPNGRKYDDT
jgi:hypothetical protein